MLQGFVLFHGYSLAIPTFSSQPKLAEFSQTIHNKVLRVECYICFMYEYNIHNNPPNSFWTTTKNAVDFPFIERFGLSKKCVTYVLSHREIH